MGILSWILFGLVVGIIAKLLMPRYTRTAAAEEGCSAGTRPRLSCVSR